MKNKITIFAAIAAASLTFAACDKFLDTLPDNRAEIDTVNEIYSILSSAYPDHDYIFVSELMADNLDNFEISYPKTIRFIDEVWNWKDVTENNNQSPEKIWIAFWTAISNANQALEAIEKLGGIEAVPELREAYGEGLVARAYSHFILVNMFCKSYSTKTSKTDLGLPYMTAPENGFKPDYKRGNVEEVYAHIEEDLEEGLKYLGDSHYTVPKYHFTVQAANAFAARFYLFYQKWDKAVEYATKCLGKSPETVLRDYKYLGTLPSDPLKVGYEYVSSKSKANLLLQTSYSEHRSLFSSYFSYAQYSHGAYLSKTETLTAPNIWGSQKYYSGIHTYSSNMDRIIFWRVPSMFEYTDPVGGTGYVRSIFPLLTTDECLLNRAEALVMLEKYDEACEDLNLWLHNITSSTYVITPAKVKAFYNSVEYSTWDAGTVKKHLDPDFKIDEPGSVQETMLQCVLGFKRIENMSLGLRWFDINRYGITIYRRHMKADGTPDFISDELKKDDPRRAMQIPQSVRDAGFEPNPR